MCHLMSQWHLPEWQEVEEQAFIHSGSSGVNHVVTSKFKEVCHRACHSVICHFLPHHVKSVDSG